MNSKTLNQRIIDNEELDLTDEEKTNAIQKEQYYRKLYNEFYQFQNTKDFSKLSIMLISGYERMIKAYESSPKFNKDIEYIIKFAFRDFFLLLFIGMKQFFDDSDFLKEMHRNVYMSTNYVTIEQFEKLLEYCRQFLDEHGTK